MSTRTDVQNLGQECRDLLSQAVKFMKDVGYKRSSIERTLPGIARVLKWLSQQPGDTWHERWLNGESHLLSTGDVLGYSIHKVENRLGLNLIIKANLIKPSYDFLLSRTRHRVKIFTENGKVHPDHALILEVAEILKFGSDLSRGAQLTYACIALHTEKRLQDFTVEDLETYTSANNKHGIKRSYNKALYNVLLYLGIITDEAIERNKRFKRYAITMEDLIHKSGMAGTPWNLPFQLYLQERSITCSLETLVSSARNIMTIYWKEILSIKPDIKSFDVPYATILAWKEKVKFLDDGQERLALGHIYIDVKSFYDFLTRMAEEDPEEWAIYEPKNPITLQEITKVMQATRKTRADMRDNTALVLPYLKIIRYELMKSFMIKRSILIWSQHALPLDEAEFDGITYVRRDFTHRALNSFNIVLVPVHDKSNSSKIIYPSYNEDTAFLLWVVFEFLYLTGLRLGELFNLLISDISVTDDKEGNLVPILRVSARKTESPRIVGISPKVSELIDIIKTRVKGEGSIYPSAIRYDKPTRKYTTRQKYLVQRIAKYSGHAVTDAYFAVQFKEFLNQLKKSDKIPHHLVLLPRETRRIHATLLYRRTRDLLKVARILGHENLEVTKMYIIHDKIDAVDLEDF